MGHSSRAPGAVDAGVNVMVTEERNKPWKLELTCEIITLVSLLSQRTRNMMDSPAVSRSMSQIQQVDHGKYVNVVLQEFSGVGVEEPPSENSKTRL